ncbi:MAG: hypothetical protein IPF73_17355 [Betaproteobacteria bacterium]|nr:hypothetical protein [Betaproteobacteria bacterium]
MAFDGSELGPALRSAGVTTARARLQGYFLMMFNMRDPVVGDSSLYVALRRVAMSFDDREWTRTFDQGLRYAQQHLIGPDVVGYDPVYRNPNAFDPATAKRCSTGSATGAASTGCAPTPDGAPLAVRMIVSTTSTGRRVAEFMKKEPGPHRRARRVRTMPPGERLKRMSRHQLTTTDFGGGGARRRVRDGELYGPHDQTVNLSCYASADHDATARKPAARCARDPSARRTSAA